ncbi:MAG: sugar kinase [Omnitrophica WOR_2 bacterium GWA2_47_8]|nr:MAG: sugar kinase [Omnitrophica WOR_2 bacterium GWA2_47_8]
MDKNKILIVGTVALDSVKTPFGERKGILGGSASFASTAASFFAKPHIVSIIGEDFPQEHLDFLDSCGIDLAGIEKKGKTFRWEGYYEFDMNEAKTLKTELNSLMDFSIDLPENYKDIGYVFVGNIDPSLQQEVIKSVRKPKLIVMDTMNFWITSKKKELLETIKQVNILLINDGEARMLFETTSLLKAANAALALGPSAVIIKKGEHGALLYTKDRHFSAPGYPLEEVRDPTGCGDTFGGAFIGYLAKTGDLSEKNLRKAIVYGSVMASYNAEDFSLDRLRTLTQKEIDSRYAKMKEIREF